MALQYFAHFDIHDVCDVFIVFYIVYDPLLKYAVLASISSNILSTLIVLCTDHKVDIVPVFLNCKYKTTLFQMPL